MNGFPVGEEYAFTHVALKSVSDSIETSSSVLPLFNLHSGPKILAACRELQPDVIVLQLGHYEAPKPLRKILGLKIAKRKSAGSAIEAFRPLPEMRYRLTRSMMFTELRRLMAAGLIIVLGKKRKMFNPGAVAEDLDSVLSSLKDLQLRGIILVGPFSAPDPLMRFCRRKMVPIFEAAAKKHNCTFIDTFAFLEAYKDRKAFQSNFADHEHLSVLGHQRVGRSVGAALKRVLERSAAETPFLETKTTLETRPKERPGWVGQPVIARGSQPIHAA